MKDRNIIDQIGEDVVLLDEDGKENTFEHILTFMYEGKKYVALSPLRMRKALWTTMRRRWCCSR